MKKTIEDVAKEAGVSITTVSRAINGNYPVKKETRERIEAAVKKLNYQPNPLARSLINKRTNTIGVIVPGITNMFFTEVIYGIEKYVKKLGFDVILSNTEGSTSLERIYINKFTDRFVDGIISLDPQTENIKNGFYEEIAVRVPLICVNGYHENVKLNFIITNEKQGTIEALEYLMEMGHRNIGFVRGGNSYSYDIKEAVYKYYMYKLGVEPTVIHIEEGNSIDVVDNASKKLLSLDGNGFDIGKDITAFFACNDLMAVGILNGCNELGLEVPGEISVLGFDNIILAQMTRPKLTTVDQNMRFLGETAAKKIINMIEKKSLYSSREVIDTKLIKRDSCNKI